MSRMTAQTINELIWFDFSSENIMNGSEKRKLVFHFNSQKHCVNLCGSFGSLQFLTVEHLFFQIFDTFSRSDERFATFSISTTVTRSY